MKKKKKKTHTYAFFLGNVFCFIPRLHEHGLPLECVELIRVVLGKFYLAKEPGGA